VAALGLAVTDLAIRAAPSEATPVVAHAQPATFPDIVPSVPVMTDGTVTTRILLSLDYAKPWRSSPIPHGNWALWWRDDEWDVGIPYDLGTFTILHHSEPSTFAEMPAGHQDAIRLLFPQAT
jgi:hypothetical protein